MFSFLGVASSLAMMWQSRMAGVWKYIHTLVSVLKQVTFYFYVHFCLYCKYAPTVPAKNPPSSYPHPCEAVWASAQTSCFICRPTSTTNPRSTHFGVLIPMEHRFYAFALSRPFLQPIDTLLSHGFIDLPIP
jgi:hypothetical protein